MWEKFFNICCWWCETFAAKVIRVNEIYRIRAPPLSWGSTWGRSRAPWSARLSPSIQGLSDQNKLIEAIKKMFSFALLYQLSSTSISRNLQDKSATIFWDVKKPIPEKNMSNSACQHNIKRSHFEWPVQLQDGREVLRVLVKEILRWIARNKLVAKLKYSLINQNWQFKFYTCIIVY